MRIYCDSSALLKRSLEEPESESLELYLERCTTRDDTLITSTLTPIEVDRVIRVRREDMDPAAWIWFGRVALSGIRQVPLDVATLSLARRVGSPRLRSLDAIHLAAAIQADVHLMLTYDRRLADVAKEMGIETARPEVA